MFTLKTMDACNTQWIGLLVALAALFTSSTSETLLETVTAERPSSFSSCTNLSYFPGVPADRDKKMTIQFR